MFWISISCSELMESDKTMLLQLLVAATTMLGDEKGAYCQIGHGGRWLNMSEIFDALELAKDGRAHSISRLGQVPEFFQKTPEQAAIEALPYGNKSVSVQANILGVSEGWIGRSRKSILDARDTTNQASRGGHVVFGRKR
jgi:hypothetical protein